MRLQILEPFGAEVRGVQLSATTASLIEEIGVAVARHRVVAFRDQDATDADLVQFLSNYGPLIFTEGETPVEEAPDLNTVSNVGRTTPPRSVFHTDTSYVARPPAFSALRAVMLPQEGGGTIFSDQVAVAAKLPARMREWLRGKTLSHSTIGVDGKPRSARHPVLRRIPATGETTLFLSTPERCSSLSGVDDGRSARIVNLLYRRSAWNTYLLRQEWRDGDIVIWDNRSTMHRADHGGVVGNRVLHRGLVEGEVPFPA